MYYAFLKPDTTLLITINSFGCLVQSAYIFFYLFYATKNARVETVRLLLLLNVAGLGLIVLLTHFLAKDSNRADIVGWICLVFALLVFVAPLCVVRQVIRTKSVEYMPFLLSFFLTLSAVMWFFYGLLRKDYNIAIPNVLGFIFGVLQMILYAIYKNGDKNEPKKQHQLSEIESQMHGIDGLKIPEHKGPIIDVVKRAPVVPILIDDEIEKARSI
ncbi:Bidirectional sugar transporter SWEET10 [Striga hermonthica]|uniref:Bidirectional sugar transporter SWEET10 n=1 Tax=Striga hermonthica TaxID=68872 RepID=A0A9N7NCS6_STRHE|nr:Bidirectional sugar transporter SWEET10 [Striga hermonthica]